jgi:predicted RNase H-like nuclease (RuvC/YqgF family)
MDYTSIVLAISAAILSGMGTAIVAGIRDNKKEKIRRQEREQDHLKLEIKDLKIALYKVERELTEWKDKYYSAIQELIGVKSELEETMLKLSFIDKAMDEYHPLDPEF